MTMKEGQVIANRYRIDEFLGRGGMAEVYKVWDQVRGVNLALKLLHADMAEDPVFLRRFKREAQTLAKLQHPSIVRCYGLEQSGSNIFMLMDFVEGTTLRKELFEAKGRPLTTTRIVEVMKQVCAALNYAHQMGLVHCDIKPANFMIDKHGRVLVADFGIARFAEGATATMVGAGTPAYMAPEQIRGEDPTARTDIYALGIVLYELFTGGERPFTGEKARTTGTTGDKVRWEQLRLEPPSLRQVNPRISPAVDAVVMKCLAKNPDDRFHGANQLYEALQAATGIQPGITSPTAEIRENIPTMDRVGQTVRLALYRLGGGKVPVWAIVMGAGILIVGLLIVLSTNKPGDQSPVVISRSGGDITSVTSFPAQEAAATVEEIPYKDGNPMALVPAGEFTMGAKSEEVRLACEQYRDACQRAWFYDSDMVFTVTLDAYLIDQYEVTNAMYDLCVKVGACDEPSQVDENENGQIFKDPSRANHPVVFVDWYQARDYCTWMGERLPTEAEWEKAARGTDGRILPWGTTKVTGDRANFCDSSCSYYYKNSAVNDGFSVTSPVGSFSLGASPYGVFDMSGNVWEWVSSLYEKYPYDATDGREELSVAGDRSARGGSWSKEMRYLFASNRYRLDPTVVHDNLGFRCVLTQ